MENLKIGDVVNIKKISNIFYWYNTDLYVIINIDRDLCDLYNLTLKELDNNPIHINHLILNIKEYRKLKLQKLCLNQETK